MTSNKTRPHFYSETEGLPESQDTRQACALAKMDRRLFLKLTGGLFVVSAAQRVGATASAAQRVATVPQPTTCAPGWHGAELIDGESLANWVIEHDTGASATLQLAPGLIGQAVQLDWDLGAGNWVQGRHAFPTPVNLSLADIFGVSLRGGGAGETANTISLMFADVNDVFYGFNLEAQNIGINQIDRWMINLAFPKRLFGYLWGANPQLDWSQIKRFFVVVKRPNAAPGGGSGHLWIDHVQYDTAANWSRQTQFAVAVADSQAAFKAISYILSQQDASTGLFVSWKEEESLNPPPKSWLYDQALALIALTREGSWQASTPMNVAARAAEKLVDFITAVQKADGHWARGWNPRTGQELVDDGWVGDQGWWVMALCIYAKKSGHASAMSSAQRGADWLVPQISPDGKVTASTEGNVDVWWALMSTARFSAADKIKNYLLDDSTVWDPNLRYWWRGFNDPVIAMDAATWSSFFARHPAVNHTARAYAALSFVRKTLVTSSQDGSQCGFDGMGPVSIWNEGTAQYVAAGGQDAQAFLDGLVSRQRPDGSLGGATESWGGNAFGWLITWSGLAPTAWFYFAIAGAPFPHSNRVYLPWVARNP